MPEKTPEELVTEHQCRDFAQHEQMFKMISDNHKQVKVYIEEDLLWKKSIQPVIDAFNTVSTSGKFINKCIMVTSKIVIAIGSIILAVYAIKEWIRKP